MLAMLCELVTKWSWVEVVMVSRVVELLVKWLCTTPLVVCRVKMRSLNRSPEVRWPCLRMLP